ncbi:cupredoxin family protein [Undibacterium sp. TS12]|uniref:cupredoxin domain-containing protein n=1 Tax=Undibacterium sp. TS12 TaxID=2908202 RepID=UPI001F4CF831|nr:cupredoxin family protein [Undibacterium sp. TS12]MCH8618720.1 cupredoxin family protein [Undibacterium sp. TS12]
MKTRLTTIAVTLTLAFAGQASFAHDDHAHGHDSEAIGKPGTATVTTRTVNVNMTDNMRFTPSNIVAKQGETIRFVIKNSGGIKHEFVLGTEKELKEHYEVMKKNPEMEHSDPNMITLAGGQTGEVVWQFTKAGKIDFACLQPGHYDAGMKGKVAVAKDKTVAAASASAASDAHGHKH